MAPVNASVVPFNESADCSMLAKRRNVSSMMVTLAWMSSFERETPSTMEVNFRFIPSVFARTSMTARSTRRDKFRTSVATTLNPRPCSPARAASMAAFSDNRFVWAAISFIVLAIFVI